MHNKLAHIPVKHESPLLIANVAQKADNFLKLLSSEKQVIYGFGDEFIGYIFAIWVSDCQVAKQWPIKLRQINGIRGF